MHSIFAGTVPFLGLGPSVLLSLPLCTRIFDSKFAFVDTACQLHKPAICFINLQGTNSYFVISQI